MAYNNQPLKNELPFAEPVWAAAKSNDDIPFAQAGAVSDEQLLYQIPSYGADAPMMYDAEARRAKKKAEDEARRNWHIASFILSALLIASILAALLLHSDDGKGAFIFISCFLALIYLIEAFAKSESFKYLWNAGRSHSALDALSALQRVPPEISATVQGYHYENRYSESTHTNADGSRETRSETSRVRVDTHRATAEFAYEKWRDLSEPVYSIARPFDIVRLHLGVKILHGDARTAAAYAAMCEQLRAVNSRRDAHFDFTEQHSVEGLKPRMLLFPEDAHATPAWMCWQWYAVSVLTLTSWFYRIALEMKTVKVVYELQKQVFVAADATAA
eukprot:7562-Heterococcus_DN1.PRE.4